MNRRNAAHCRRIHLRLMGAAWPALSARYPPAVTAQVLAEASAEFSRLLPSLPLTGGRPSNLANTLIQAASILALYRALQPLGITVPEYGVLVDETARGLLALIPAPLRRLAGWLYMTRWNRRRLAAQAAMTAHGNWRFTVIEGDGTGFEWGINYERCAIVEFLRAQGAEAVAPYMCPLDARAFPALGIDMRRSGTIAGGSAVCDFRFRRVRA